MTNLGPEQIVASSNPAYREKTEPLLALDFTQLDQVTETHGKSDAYMQIKDVAGHFLTATLTWSTFSPEQCQAFLDQLFVDLKSWEGDQALRYYNQVVTERLKIVREKPEEKWKWLDKWQSRQDWPNI